MLTLKDLDNIDRNYFNIIHATSLCVTLQSKNTRHYWHILYEEYPHFKTYQIFHKHNEFDAYHFQKNQCSFLKAIETIKAHDNFQINVRNKQRRTHHNHSIAAGL